MGHPRETWGLPIKWCYRKMFLSNSKSLVKRIVLRPQGVVSTEKLIIKCLHNNRNMLALRIPDSYKTDRCTHMDLYTIKKNDYL